MEETQNQTPEPVATTATPAKSQTTKWIIIGIVVLVALGAIQSMFFNPERLSEKMLERATGGQYDVDIDRDGSVKVKGDGYEMNTNDDGQGTMQIKGDDGEQINISTGENIKLPDNWPSSIPLPNDAKISYAQSGGSADGSGQTVAFTTRDSMSEVTEFYKSELADKGWTIEATMVTTDGGMVSATQGEDSVIISIGSTDGETAVTIGTARN